MGCGSSSTAWAPKAGRQPIKGAQLKNLDINIDDLASKHQLGKVTRAFAAGNSAGTGKLDPRGFGKAFGCEGVDSLIFKLFSQLDLDRNGVIDLREFLLGMAVIGQGGTNMGSFTFLLLDPKNKRGEVTVDTLRGYFASMAESQTENDDIAQRAQDQILRELEAKRRNFGLEEVTLGRVEFQELVLKHPRAFFAAQKLWDQIGVYARPAAMVVDELRARGNLAFRDTPSQNWTLRKSFARMRNRSRELLAVPGMVGSRLRQLSDSSLKKGQDRLRQVSQSRLMRGVARGRDSDEFLEVSKGAKRGPAAKYAVSGATDVDTQPNYARLNSNKGATGSYRNLGNYVDGRPDDPRVERYEEPRREERERVQASGSVLPNLGRFSSTREGARGSYQGGSRPRSSFESEGEEGGDLALPDIRGSAERRGGPYEVQRNSAAGSEHGSGRHDARGGGYASPERTSGRGWRRHSAAGAEHGSGRHDPWASPDGPPGRRASPIARPADGPGRYNRPRSLRDRDLAARASPDRRALARSQTTQERSGLTDSHSNPAEWASLRMRSSDDSSLSPAERAALRMRSHYAERSPGHPAGPLRRSTAEDVPMSAGRRGGSREKVGRRRNTDEEAPPHAGRRGGSREQVGGRRSTDTEAPPHVGRRGGSGEKAGARRRGGSDEIVDSPSPGGGAGRRGFRKGVDSVAKQRDVLRRFGSVEGMNGRAVAAGGR